MAKRSKVEGPVFEGEAGARRARLLQVLPREEPVPDLKKGREGGVSWLVANRAYRAADELAKKEGMDAETFGLHVLEAVEPLASRAPHDRSKDALAVDKFLHIANAYVLGGLHESGTRFAERYYRVKMHAGVTPLEVAQAREAAALAAHVHLERTAEEDAAKAAIAARLELGEEIHPLMARHKIGREDAAVLVKEAFHAHLAAGRRELAKAIIQKNPRVWREGDIALKEHDLL